MLLRGSIAMAEHEVEQERTYKGDPRDYPETDVVPESVIGLVAMLQRIIELSLTVRCRLSSHDCSWNSCDNQASTGRVLSEEWISAFLCERHESAVDNMLRRPRRVPSVEYWRAVVGQDSNEEEVDTA
jgi:hypothetical protein